MTFGYQISKNQTLKDKHLFTQIEEVLYNHLKERICHFLFSFFLFFMRSRYIDSSLWPWTSKSVLVSSFTTTPELIRHLFPRFYKMSPKNPYFFLLIFLIFFVLLQKGKEWRFLATYHKKRHTEDNLSGDRVDKDTDLQIVLRLYIEKETKRKRREKRKVIQSYFGVIESSSNFGMGFWMKVYGSKNLITKPCIYKFFV